MSSRTCCAVTSAIAVVVSNILVVAARAAVEMYRVISVPLNSIIVTNFGIDSGVVKAGRAYFYHNATSAAESDGEKFKSRIIGLTGLLSPPGTDYR